MSFPAAAIVMLMAGAPDTSGGFSYAPAAVAAPEVDDLSVWLVTASAQAGGAQASTLPSKDLTSPSPGTPPASDTGQSDILVEAHAHVDVIDPFEKANAKAFEVTQAVDVAIIGPVALAYAHTVPRPIRVGLRNALNNLREPTVFLNYLIQLKPGKAGETLGRFAVNSTIGFAGLFDAAKNHPFNLPRRPNGFGDSMGYYGVKTGPYLFLPLIGPTTLRDLVGGTLDRLVLPTAGGAPFNQLVYTIPTGVVSGLDRRAEFDQQLHKFRDDSAEPYAARRQFYLQGRQAEIQALHGTHQNPLRPASNPVTSKVAPGDESVQDGK